MSREPRVAKQNSGERTVSNPAAAEITVETPLAIPNASEIAARYIRALIFSGELGPGDRLSSGRDLAARLGISVGTLRIAIGALEATGYIVTSRGARGGSRVNDIDALLRCWTSWMRENGDEVDDLFEFREAVETRMATLAAERRTESDLQTINKALNLFGETPPSVLRWNAAFHDAVAAAAHSRYLRRAMIDLRADLFLPVDLAVRKHRLIEIRDSHLAVAIAIRDGDRQAAAEAMRTHVAETRDMMMQSLADAHGDLPAGST